MRPQGQEIENWRENPASTTARKFPSSSVLFLGAEHSRPSEDSAARRHWADDDEELINPWNGLGGNARSIGPGVEP